jgi:outer membrane protein assembly factor BamA
VARRWWRRILWALAASLALLLLTVGALLLAWQLPTFRQALLRRVGASLAARTGLAITVADLQGNPLAGRLTLTGLQLGAGEGPPLLTLERVEVALSLRSLLQPPVLVHRLALDGLRWDASARLPSWGTGAPAPGGPPPVVIRELVVPRGTVVGLAVPPPLAPYLRQLSPLHFEVAGSFMEGRFAGDLAVQGTLTDTAGHVHPITAQLALTASSDGAFQLRRAKLETPGLALSGSAAGRGFALAGEAHLEADLGKLLPQLGVSGQVKLHLKLPQGGSLALVVLQAREVSLAGLQAAHRPPLAALGLFRGSWEVEGHTALPWPPEPAAPVPATLRTRWQEAGETLLFAELSPTLAGNALEARFELALLPEKPGRRRLAGSCRWTQLPHPETARLEQVQLELAAPALRESWQALARFWPELVPPLPGEFPLEGSLSLLANLTGPALRPRVQLRASYTSPQGELQLQAQGELPELAGQGELQFARLDLRALAPQLAGRVSGRVQAAGNRRAWHGSFALAGVGVVAGPLVFHELAVEGETDGRGVVLSALSLRRGEDLLTGSLAVPSLAPLEQAQASLQLRAPTLGLEETTVRASLAAGTLQLGAEAQHAAAGPVWLSAQLPLGTLERWVEALSRLPGPKAHGPLFLQLAAPSLDSCRLAPLLPAADRPERVLGGLQAVLQLDPQEPAAALGQLVASGVRLEREGALVAQLARGELLLAGGQLQLLPTELVLGPTAVSLAGQATLAERWSAEKDPLSALVERFSGQARGKVPTALLQPYLAGAEAAGELQLAAQVEGTPQRFALFAELDGRGTSFFWPSPYPARLEDISARAHLSPAGDATFTAQGELNGGTLSLLGSRSAGGDGELQVELSGARFRLDLGLLVQADASLLLSLPSRGERSLSGKVHLRRAQLERPLSLENEVIPFFLAPTATPGTAGGFADTVALDVAVESESGLRVRNNLADLRVRWDELHLRGTLWRPHLEGQLEVDPGGVVRAWGQTLRLDRVVATFTGDPLTDPRLDLAVTSSWEDPTVGQGARSVLAHLAGEEPSAAATGGQAAGLASTRFLGSAAAATLAQALGGAAEVRLEPVLVFAEADPSARLTVSRPLNAYASFALSVDLRSAQRQTYLVELHNFPRVASLTAQVFTNDAGNAGATVQQAFAWGAGQQRAARALPTLRRLVWQAPRSLGRKPLLRALGVQRGMALAEGIEGDWQLELEYLLRQQGFPDAQVQLARRPVPGKKNRVDLHVAIEPGERVAFSFRPNVLPKGQLPLIRALYRSGVWEPAALEDIRQATVRVLRAMGYLDPQVEVTVVPATAGKSRLVTVAARPGRRLPHLATLRVPGLPEDEQEVLRARFAGKVELLELAAGLDSAKEQLRSALATLGYPTPRILGTSLEDQERTLVVEVEPGPREVLGSVGFSGAAAEELPQLEALAACEAGNPARRDRIAAAVAAITGWYQARGFPRVRVTPRLAPRPQEPLVLDLELVVEKGPAQRVQEVVLAGRHRLADSLGKKLVGLAPGEPLVLQKVHQGRRLLWATGLFRTVRTEIVPQEEGMARVVYHLQEEPSLALAYGLRWEATQGAAAVVDFTDRNLLGRMVTLGLRGLYEKNRQAGRLYLGLPDVLASGVQAETFLELRRRTTEGTPGSAPLVEDSTRLTLQLKKPFANGLVSHLYGRWQKTHIFERTEFFPLDITLRFPYAGLGLTYDSRDDKVLAQRGVLLSLDLSGTSRLLGADLQFLRLYGQLATFRPFAWGKLSGSWAQSLRFGWAAAGTGEELIRSERFFAGGEYSVRGYHVDSLGPVEDLGYTSRPAGGKAMLVVNQELRIPLPWDLVGILFLDAGQVWAEPSQVRPEDLAAASGVGVRARTPLGTLRLDVALPWEKTGGSRKPKLYLGFGSAF